MPRKDKGKQVECTICTKILTLGAFKTHVKLKHKNKLKEWKKYIKEDPSKFNKDMFVSIVKMLDCDHPSFPGVTIKVKYSL